MEPVSDEPGRRGLDRVSIVDAKVGEELRKVIDAVRLPADRLGDDLVERRRQRLSGRLLGEGERDAQALDTRTAIVAERVVEIEQHEVRLWM